MKRFLNVFVFVLSLFGSTAFGQELTAFYKSEEDLFQNGTKSISSSFRLDVSEEKVFEIKNATSPLYEQIKVKFYKKDETSYDFVIHFKLEKENTYLIEILKLIGVSNVQVGEVLIPVEELLDRKLK